MSRAATDGIAGVVFVAVLVLFLTIKFIGQFGPGIIDGTVAFPTSLIQSKINKLRVLTVRWFTASVKLQMKFADLPPTCSVEELHSSKAMYVRTLEELGGVRHDWEMSQDMLEDAKLETHDAQVRESQSVDEHHAKELYITTLLDRIKQYEDGSLTIVQDDEYIKDLNRAIDEKDAYIAKQNDIIKDKNIEVKELVRAYSSQSDQIACLIEQDAERCQKIMDLMSQKDIQKKDADQQIEFHKMLQIEFLTDRRTADEAREVALAENRRLKDAIVQSEIRSNAVVTSAGAANVASTLRWNQLAELHRNTLEENDSLHDAALNYVQQIATMRGRITELEAASQEMPQFLRTASNQRRRICGSVASDLPIVSNDATDGTIAGVRGIFGIMFPVVSPNTPTDIAPTEPFPMIVECDGSDYPNSDSDGNGGGPPAHMLRGYSQSDLDTQSGSEAVVRDEPLVVLPAPPVDVPFSALVIDAMRSDQTLVLEGDGFIRAPPGETGSYIQDLRLRDQRAAGLSFDTLPYKVLRSRDFSFSVDGVPPVSPRNPITLAEINTFWANVWINYDVDSPVTFYTQHILRALMRRMWVVRIKIGVAFKNFITDGKFCKIEAQRQASSSQSPTPPPPAVTAVRTNLNLCEVYNLGWRSFYAPSLKHKIHIHKSCGWQGSNKGPVLSEDVLNQCLLGNPNDVLMCAGCTRDPAKGVVFDP